MVVRPKDKTPDDKKCGVVYRITCPDCQDTYVGETGRALQTRMKDHLSTRAPLTAVGEHCQEHRHKIKTTDVEIITREEHLWSRKIREAIEIRTQTPTLNRDTGYDLPAIYQQLLSHDRATGRSCDTEVYVRKH